MRALVAQRQMDVEDAIFGVDPYKVIPEFQHLAVDPTVFRSMSKEQRLAVIKRFNKVTVTHLIEEDQVKSPNPIPFEEFTLLQCSFTIIKGVPN